MSDHKAYQELLPLYVARQTSFVEREAVEEHLAVCAECQADLAMWQEVSAEISTLNQALSAPPGLAERALEGIKTPSPLQAALRRAGQLLRAQAMLVHRELWLASALVLALGVIVALIAGKENVLGFLAPLVAAACLAVIYGPEHDPAIELARSTPTSSWKILLARLTLVSGYNLLSTFIASLVLLSVVPAGLFGSLILGWLGPLTFLSALALLLSLWIGTSNAIAVTYGLWILQHLQLSRLLDNWRPSSAWESFMSVYQRFWESPALLLSLSLGLVILALLSSQRSGRMMSPSEA
jgi:anti-sigma factor RsiW